MLKGTGFFCYAFDRTNVFALFSHIFGDFERTNFCVVNNRASKEVCEMAVIIVTLITLVLSWFAAGIVIAYLGSNRNGNIYKVLGKNEPAGEILQTVDRLRRKTPELVSEEYEITNRNGIRLHGYLIRAKRPSNVYVFFSHGYRSPDGGMEFGSLLPMWKDHDYNFFFVDHRGHGKSGGSHISFGQYESEDNLEWLDFMLKTFGEDIQIILEGQSMGAATVLMMSGKKLPGQVKFIIADCGFTNYFDTALHMLQFPGKRIVLEATNLYLTLRYGINMKKPNPQSAVTQAQKPILFTHGEKDPLVPVEMGRKNYEACTSEKKLHIFLDGEHCTAPIQHPVEYAAVVDEYISKYLNHV
jgi:fermentation-respiration switch protein FrsA (DUF1100 family)